MPAYRNPDSPFSVMTGTPAHNTLDNTTIGGSISTLLTIKMVHARFVCPSYCVPEKQDWGAF
ncbi:MAG: hypothetical protein GY774_06035 [Planctomycetes bacterium]|nr:hypothetical protein [Planctomycetota bacterium]